VQSLVQNGGFETGDFTGWTLAGNGTIFTPFGTTVYNAVEDAASYPSVVHSGNYGAFLGDTQLATLTQTLSTVPGEIYLLSLWLDNVTNGSPQQFQVNWNDNGIYGITNPPSFSWTNLQFIVTASSGSSVLQFGAENAPAYFGLDDVCITHIPALSLKAVTISAGTLNLAWAAATGLVYQVQYKTNLMQPNWINWDKPVFAASNRVTTTDNSSSPRRFYRLTVAP
jgi:hypothetical protein